MKTLLSLCTAILILTSWNTFAEKTTLLNTPEQCESRARTLCAEHINHPEKYNFCLKEIYNACIRQ
ncbi:hypothetical protein Xbed_00326 [Xenorhabdus beddingii]|uniref:Uncharacterized protein n=1 Tax=Xenorhabdus beddingii TaxID=40578 RepID=A0A1Y2SRU1_9GAMM|nr:hypothetical protein [Xenorhabdus beddingii]OTA21579.1 hypothetical protein Xbed_00326 [Xenorhabdus beddingii]